MLRKKKNYLKQIYKMNPETNAFIIEISLDSYNEIFNGWDPSPIKRRDLDPDLVHFMEECDAEIPLNYPLELQFYLPKEQLDEDKENLTRIGIKNNFSFTALFIMKELDLIKKKIVFYILTAFAFLWVGYLSRQQVEANIITSVLTEGLTIGGWVFLWEVFSLFFFSRQEVLARLKRYKRFKEANISFSYK